MPCCTRDEGRPLGGGVQTRPPNRLELLPLRAVVVSVKEKAQNMRQVRVAEMNVSELSMKCRKEPLNDVESALGKQRVTSPAGIWLLAGRHPAYRQHERNTGFRRERGEPVVPMSRERRGAEALQAPEYRCGTQGQMAL